MRNAIALIFVSLLLVARSTVAEPLFIEKSYDGFSVVDCRQNGPIVYQWSSLQIRGTSPDSATSSSTPRSPLSHFSVERDTAALLHIPI